MFVLVDYSIIALAAECTHRGKIVACRQQILELLHVMKNNSAILHSLESIRGMLQRAGLPAGWSSIAYMPSHKAQANAMLRELLLGDRPCMIARLGYFELGAVANYLSICSGRKAVLSYLAGRSGPWWWERKLAAQLGNNAGFFPVTDDALVKFSELLLADMADVDVLGSWLRYEREIAALGGAAKVALHDLEPFFAPQPWTHALAGKTVLVVHPFEQTIVSQHARLGDVFPDGMIPPFTLKTVRAVQTIAGEPSVFADWFAALDYMKAAMDATEYDICIIGAGAYGLPLAAHAKRMGKKAFHIGGVAQMLFGIKGRRWDESAIWPYRQLYNEYWVRPSASELPVRAKKVEGACYW